jgi:tRNA G37 N-methylase Trm5
MFSDLIVKHGPFQGMKYAKAKALGSSYMPKMVGSYERELHPTIEKICKIPYTKIVNVGCGEGYYAVGLAMKIPTAKVYAYDIDPEASQLCSETAKCNGVDSRVFTHTSSCDIDIFTSDERGLVICDCEGCEETLFTPELISYCLVNWDLIIEAHDFVTKTNTSAHLQELFKATHQVEVVKSISDNEKMNKYIYSELKNCDQCRKRGILAEYRPCTMEWVCAFTRRVGESCQ